MLAHHQRVLAVKSRASRGKARLRRRPGRRLWVPEGLENRVLLSGGPTMYTVNSTDGGVSGTGDSGTLPYVIGLANNDPNTAGSEIQFALPSSGSPPTIALSSTLVLSEKAGPEMIDGPGASLVTVSGNNSVEVFSVGSNVTASLSGLTIANGRASQGGGLSVDGGTVSLTNVNVINNQAVGADGAAGSAGQSGPGGPGGNGNSGLGGGIYLAEGSLTLNGDTIASNFGAAVRGRRRKRCQRRIWRRGRSRRIGSRRRYLCR